MYESTEYSYFLKKTFFPKPLFKILLIILEGRMQVRKKRNRHPTHKYPYGVGKSRFRVVIQIIIQ